MLESVLWVVAGLVLLYAGAELLVRGSANLALRMGVPSMVVGLTVVAYGTSAPELVVSTRAALDGLGDIAIGNIVGSNVFNIAAVLGLSGLVRPLRVKVQIVGLDTPIMIAVSFLLLALLHDRTLGRLEGVVLFAGAVCYTVLTVVVGRRAPSSVSHPPQQTPSRSPGLLILDVVFIVSGLVMLVFGSRFLVTGATDMARTLGISEAVIGLTIVAAGTSLPELATSIVAAAKKEVDIAVGNVVGSNIFNILAILGISSVLTPLHSPGIGATDLWFMVGTAVILLPFMWSGFVLNRIESLILLGIFGAYLYSLWP
jgi:cation:H+ antiporter